MANNYNNLDKLLMDIRKELDYQKYLTPINFEYENKKFIDCYNNKREYNPQYAYNKFDNHIVLEKYNRLKEQFAFDGTEIGEIYKKYIDTLYFEIMMYSNIGSDKFAGLSVEVYGNPDRKYYKKALDILSDRSDYSESEMVYDSGKMADIFKRRIENYGFEWDVILSSNMAARVSVEPEQKIVYINQNKRFSFNDSIRLQAHEIDTHILRTENGYLRNYIPFAFGTAQSMVHEEGMALYNEYKNNVLDSFSEILYAARFVVGININHTFFELYNMLKEYGCSDFIAMYVVSRFKRGVSDTSCSGGFIKDYLYFQGLQEITSAIEKDESIYNKMYFGSIGLNDVQILNATITSAINEKSVILPSKEKFFL
jgi:hypothetical protein